MAQKQKITDSDLEDKDVIALAASDKDAVVQVFFIRDGKTSLLQRQEQGKRLSLHLIING